MIIPHKTEVVKGTFLALLAFFCMAVFGVFTKLASVDSSKIWVSFLSYISATITLSLFVFRKGISFLKTEHFSMHFVRAFFGLGASFTYMLALQYIPLANATLLFNTAPLFIPFLSIIWFKKKLPISTWWSVVLGFIGVLIILHPTTDLFTQYQNMLGLISGISLAIAYFAIKLLTDTDSRYLIIFYYLFLGTLFQIPLLFWAGEMPPGVQVFYAILAGLVLLLAQIFLVQAYQLAQASQIGVFQYSSVVFVGLLDWMIWHQVPTLLDIIGVVIVILAAYIIIHNSTE